jgi:hypothetical protein
MGSGIRLFLTLEALALGMAAFVHGGVLARGHEHWRAATAESVIALVLVLALASSGDDARMRRIGLLAQGFALLGVCVGLVMIAIGIGPRTTPDLVFHALVSLLLIAGLIHAWRAGAPS